MYGTDPEGKFLYLPLFSLSGSVQDNKETMGCQLERFFMISFLKYSIM
jgi:hypothetical protein